MSATKPQASNSNHQRIGRLSRIMGRFFATLVWLWPTLSIFFWLAYNQLPVSLKSGMVAGPGISFPEQLDWGVRLLALAGNLPAVIVAVMALRCLVRLFGLYSQGIYFQQGNVREFKKLGLFAVASVITDVVAKTVLTLAATINNPPGQRLLAISFSSDHFKLLLVALLLTIIGLVMEEGQRINDEHQLTV